MTKMSKGYNLGYQDGMEDMLDNIRGKVVVIFIAIFIFLLVGLVFYDSSKQFTEQTEACERYGMTYYGKMQCIDIENETMTINKLALNEGKYYLFVEECKK